MPRKLSTKVPVVNASIPSADVYRVLEININNTNKSIHVFYGAYESQPDIDGPNPLYVEELVANPAYVDEQTTPDVEEFIYAYPSNELPTIKQAVADVLVHTEGIRYQDADIIPFITAVTLDGETMYDAIKRVAYTQLEADGYFPSGGTDE